MLFTAILLAGIFSFSYYAYYIARAEFVWVGKRFYFLVSSDSHVEAATHITRLEGGAGYLLADGEGEYTAYSVYLSDDIAHAVQTNMQETAQLVEKQVDYLVFKGRNKRLAAFYSGALSGLYGCIDVLSQSISKLEGGMLQQTCKRLLTILEKQFGYMANAYQNEYPIFSQTCKTLRENLGKIISDVVFCRDLRYLLCMACDTYVQLSSEFVL